MPTFELIMTALGVFLLPIALGMARIDGPGFYTENAHPAFIKDYLSRDRVLPGGAMLDPSGFSKADETVLTAGSAAAQNDTTIALSAAIPTDDRGAQVRIPSGTLLDFGTNVVELAADAVTGDASLTVAPLPAGGVGNGDTATYAGQGPKFVPPGTVVGRTRSEAEANAGFSPVAFTPGTSVDDDEVYLTVYPVQNAETNAEVELLRPNAGTVLVYSLIPGWADMDSAVQNWIHNNFTTTQAAD